MHSRAKVALSVLFWAVLVLAITIPQFSRVYLLAGLSIILLGAFSSLLWYVKVRRDIARGVLCQTDTTLTPPWMRKIRAGKS